MKHRRLGSAPLLATAAILTALLAAPAQGALLRLHAVGPDGDFEHAFLFDDGPYRPVHPDALDFLPPRIVTRFTEEETRWSSIASSPGSSRSGSPGMGEPVSGADLVTCVARCPCGTCCGLSAPVDQGVSHLGASFSFYLEDTARVLLLDRATEALLWEGDPREWPDTGEVVRIELDP